MPCDGFSPYGRETQLVVNISGGDIMRMAHYHGSGDLQKKGAEKHNMAAFSYNCAVGDMGQIHRLAGLVAGFCTSLRLRLRNGFDNSAGEAVKDEKRRISAVCDNRLHIRTAAPGVHSGRSCHGKIPLGDLRRNKRDTYSRPAPFQRKKHQSGNGTPPAPVNN